ncbi:MAG: pyrroline-5-carboxylate reductase [Actinomycetota bacterium]
MAGQDRNISFIGGGRMGEALVRGLIRGGAERSSLVVYDTDATRIKKLASELGVTGASSAAEAVSNASVVIIAVKPKDVSSALSEIHDSLSQNTVVISIAAGVPSSVIAGGLPAGTKVVRVMPNSPAGKGAAITAIAAGHGVGEEEIALAADIFDAVGLVTMVPEKAMNAVTALSGSGPAYFYFFIKALTDAGEAQGLDRETAFKLAHETMFGASRLLKYSKKSSEELIAEVRSPGGTTAAALEVFEASGLAEIVDKAVAAATKRAAELAKQPGSAS